VRSAGDFLLEDEAKHALMLGHAGNLERGIVDGAGAYLATLHEEERVVGAALRLAGRDLVTTSLSAEAIVRLVDELHPLGALPGVHAPLDTAKPFAAAWCGRTGSTAERKMGMCMHACERVVPSARMSTGVLRVADDGDLDLIAAWSESFLVDAGLPPRSDQRAIVRRHIGERSAHLWEVEGAPVSMAIVSGATASGTRIGGVFTPRALRGRGHASGCVASLTQQLLDSGKQRCFLYTDVANPTSNALYRRLGYRPIADYEEWQFA
jgi:RimJ/RimL family protein N-acetyltransferase